MPNVNDPFVVIENLEQMQQDMQQWAVENHEEPIVNVSPILQGSGAAAGNPFFGQIKPKKTKPKPIVKTKEGGLIQLLQVGADVEEFLRDEQGQPVPVIGLIGGTKQEPLSILTKGYALQEDNVALEYNIPPATTTHEFVYSLMRVQEEIRERLKPHRLVPAIEASMRFDAKALDHPQARAFGCEPDYNVWEQCVNEKPGLSPEAATLRTAGGHVHVSFNVLGEPPKHPENIAEMEAVIMALDLYVGAPMVLMDKDQDRRKLYGKAGAFRPKPYGVEYRVLSNYWTRTPELMAWVFGQVKRAITYVNMKGNPRAHLLEFKHAVYAAINEGDLKTAKELSEYCHVQFPQAV